MSTLSQTRWMIDSLEELENLPYLISWPVPLHHPPPRPIPRSIQYSNYISTLSPPTQKEAECHVVNDVPRELYYVVKSGTHGLGSDQQWARSGSRPQWCKMGYRPCRSFQCQVAEDMLLVVITLVTSLKSKISPRKIMMLEKFS